MGILGAVVAWVWSVYTWQKSQAAQRLQMDYNRKENLYRELLRTLDCFYKGGPQSHTGPFLEQYRLAWLYAPDNVIKILNSVASSLKVDPSEQHLPPEQLRQVQVTRDVNGARALSELVAAIRMDLLGTAGRPTKLQAGDFGHYS